jgi:hypothetical protein
MPRIVANQEKPSELFNQFYGTNKYNRYFYLRIGRVVEVDQELYQFIVDWSDGGGPSQWIPMSFPYVGPGGIIGAFPEIGSLAICGYINQGFSGKGMPFCLAFVPTGLQAALEHNAVKQIPDSLSTEEDNLFFMKFRKLQKGDVIMSSLFGGEVFLNRDIELKDSLRDSILVRSSDQSIVMTSLQSFMFNSGVAMRSGPIIRNKASIFDSKGNRIPDQLVREVSLPDGRDSIYMVPFGKPIEENSLFYSEYRLDVEDLVDGAQELNDINSQTALSKHDPIVAFTLGNYASNHDTNPRYAKMLRPTLFASSSDAVGQFNLIECVQNKGLDEVAKLGMAFVVHMLKNDTFMGIDKEGHFYLNLNASSNANPLGAGRSMSILGSGNLKEIWGMDSDTGNAWDFSTKGGIHWNIGAHNARKHNRSIDIRTSSGMKLEVMNNDDEGFARQENIYGNQKITIGGNESTTISGESDLIVDGLKKEDIRGSASYSYQTDKSENVMGVFTQTVIKEMQGKFGKRKETILNGQELQVITGDILETISTFGNKKTKLTKGNIEENIIAGNRNFTIIKGDYKVSITSGNINISTTTGKATLKGTTGVTINGKSIDLNGPKVSIGSSPVKGGVMVGLPGAVSYYESLTGLPGRGSSTVKAAL